MDSFTWHIHDAPILAGGHIPTSLPPSALDDNLTLRLTQQFQIELLYLFITDAVNVVNSRVTCELFSHGERTLQVVENRTIGAQYYQHAEDLIQDVSSTVGRCVTVTGCLLYTSPSPRDLSTSRMPSSA